MLVHHLRKTQDKDDPFNEISGTTGLMGAADTVLLLKKVNRGTDTTFLYLTGRDIEFRAMAIEFTNCYWRLDEDVPPHDGICYRPLAPIVKTVCEYIKEHKHFRGTASELLALLGEENVKPNVLTRSLSTEAYDYLQQVGITYDSGRTGIDGKKIDSGYTNYYSLREASDEICLKYGLSVIKNPKGHTPRNIYFDEKAGKPTRYNLMRWAIDEARKVSPTWQDFILHLRDKGYEFDRNEGGKYPKIKPKDGKQWTRIHNLGEDYSLASIDKTIEANYWKGLCGYASYVGKIKNNNIRNLRHPPRQHWLYAPERDYGPLLTLVLTFVYLLGGPDLITPNDPAPKYQPITPEMREATRKCEMYSRQAVLMGQEDINTKEDADAFLERTERELIALERKRKDLYNSIRRCNDPEIKAQVQEEIHALTAEMKPLRRQISDIKNVLERSGVMREMVEAEEKMRREKLEREYFLNPKEKAKLKNTQPKSSEQQTQPRKRDDDRGR